jgi:hypothetical protein
METHISCLLWELLAMIFSYLDIMGKGARGAGVHGLAGRHLPQVCAPWGEGQAAAAQG